VNGHELVVDEVSHGGAFGKLTLLTGELRAVRAQAVQETQG
jgi:hypothetical protein